MIYTKTTSIQLHIVRRGGVALGRGGRLVLPWAASKKTLVEESLSSERYTPVYVLHLCRRDRLVCDRVGPTLMRQPYVVI